MKWFWSSGTSVTDAPDYIARYHQVSRTKYNPKLSIRRIRFVVFDTETTGLNPKKDTWLSLGAIVVEQQAIRVDQSLECTVQRSDIDISEQVIVHGITQTKLGGGIPETEVLRHWLQFIDNSVLVAHHAAFDKEIINRALNRLYPEYQIRLHNPLLDTAALARRLDRFNTLPEAQNPADYSLDVLCQRFQITPTDRHTAAGDAFITAQLLLKLLAEAERRGIRTFRQLLK
ncbi:MAG: 3'-5' exonuclease [Bacteroidota bacterium]